MEHDAPERFRRADGRAMAYRRVGHGPPVVCLAGGPGANAVYLEGLGGLDRAHLLIIPDARGTGHSAPAATPGGYGFDSLAGDVESLRAHLGFEKVRLLAHSAACATALVYAAAHPRRLRSLVLVAPSGRLHDGIEDDTEQILRRRSDEPWYPAVRAARARLEAGPDPDEIAELLVALAPASYAEWGEREQAHAALMRPTNWEATRLFWRANVDERELRLRLSSVPAPVLVVTGDLDAATGVTPGRGWAGCFPHGRHVTIPGAGHHPWVDRPRAFAQAVTQFLAA